MVWTGQLYLFFKPMQFVHNLTIINSSKPSGYYLYHQVYDLKIHYVQIIYVWYELRIKSNYFPA